MGCEIKYSTIFIQWWAHLRGLQSLMANMVILGQNNHFQGTPRDIFMGAKNSQMTVPDMKYNVEPSLTNVEPIWGRWNHLWPIWQCRAKIGRFLGLLGPPRDIFMGAKNTQLTVPDMKYNVLTNLTNVQPIWGSWNHLWPIWQFRAQIGRFWGPPGP